MSRGLYTRLLRLLFFVVILTSRLVRREALDEAAPTTVLAAPEYASRLSGREKDVDGVEGYRGSRSMLCPLPKTVRMSPKRLVEADAEVGLWARPPPIDSVGLTGSLKFRFPPIERTLGGSRGAEVAVFMSGGLLLVIGGGPEAESMRGSRLSFEFTIRFASSSVSEGASPPRSSCSRMSSREWLEWWC